MTKIGAVLLVAAFDVVLGLSASASAAEPPRGRSLALANCAFCHVVAPDQGFAPMVRPQGPDFAKVAANPKTTAKGLQRFLRTTHKNPGNGRESMPNPLLTPTQIDDLVSFILGQAPARTP